MPFVAGSAQRVAESYGATNAAQQGVFNQAWQRLNSLRGERAAEAQALAQQIGAPVPLDGLFTEAIDVERGAFVPEAAGELLKASTIGQAGVQQAEAFAGRVFPLKQARMHREIKNYYRDQITDLRKNIASLKSMKPGLVNERLRQRQLEDYEMRLNRAEALFQREQTKRGLALEERRLKLQQAELNEQKRQANIGVSEAAKDRKLRTQLSKGDKKMANRTYVNQQKQNIVTAVNSLVSPTKERVKEKRSGWIENPDTGQLEFKSWDEYYNTGPDAVRNPVKLLNSVLATLGIQPGQKELYNFAVSQVIQSLRVAGVGGIPKDPKKWAKWWKDRQVRSRTKAATKPYPGLNKGFGGREGGGR
jgi:hypothetical protein